MSSLLGYGNALVSLPNAEQKPRDGHLVDQTSKSAHGSPETVRHAINRRSSASPAGSLGSISSGAFRATNELSSTAFRVTKENMPPGRDASYTVLPPAIAEDVSSMEQTPTKALNHPIYGGGLVVSQSSLVKPVCLDYGDYREDIDLTAGGGQIQPLNSSRSRSLSETRLDEQIVQRSLGEEVSEQESTDAADEEHPDVVMSRINSYLDISKAGPHTTATDAAPHGFKRMMSTFRPRRFSGPQHLKASEERSDLGDEFEPPLDSSVDLDIAKHTGTSGHRKTSSWSSNGFVGGVKSTTSGLSSSSATARSHKSHWSRLSRFGKGGSRLSDASNRRSLESTRGSSPIMDKAAIHRALQRRKVIGELIASETGYIADLKILTHVRLGGLQCNISCANGSLGLFRHSWGSPERAQGQAGQSRRQHQSHDFLTRGNPL